MEGLGSGVRQDDPATWRPPAWPPSYRGILNSLEVAHQVRNWFTAQLYGGLDAFEGVDGIITCVCMCGWGVEVLPFETFECRFP